MHICTRIHKNKVKSKTCSWHVFIVSQTGIPTHHIRRYSKPQCEANLAGDRTSALQENWPCPMDDIVDTCSLTHTNAHKYTHMWDIRTYTYRQIWMYTTNQLTVAINYMIQCEKTELNIWTLYVRKPGLCTQNKYTS